MMNKYFITLKRPIMLSDGKLSYTVEITTTLKPEWNDGFYSIGNLLIESDNILSIQSMDDVVDQDVLLG